MINHDYKEQINDVIEQDEENDIQVQENWKIKNLSEATWADEKIKEAEDKIANVNKVRDEAIEKLEQKIERLKEWGVEATKKDQQTIDFFKLHLHLWHQDILEQEQRNGIPEKKQSKTIKLPYRDLTCRKQQPEILIYGKEPSKMKNDPNFVAFVKANNPEFIKEEVAWGDYKKTLKQGEKNGKLVYVDDAGQTLDFVELIDKGLAFDYKNK
jgi:hypothetical protein